MKNKIFIIVFALSIFTDSDLFAQSLDTLITEAMKNNNTLISLKHKIRANEWKEKEVNNLPAPTVGLEFSQVPVGKFDLLNEPLSQNLSISQMFMLGGKLQAMSDMEHRNTILTQNEFDIYKTRLKGLIKMSYYELWMTDQKAVIQKKNIGLLNELLQLIRSMNEYGTANQADVLLASNEIALNETQLINLERQRNSSIVKLNSLIGNNFISDSLKSPAEIYSPVKQLNNSALNETLVKANPSLKKMDSMIEMGGYEKNVNDKELIPDLMIQGMIMRMPKGMILTTQSEMEMVEKKADYMYSIMASITLPFAPWSAKKYAAREEEIYSKIEGIRSEKTAMELEMKTGINDALIKLNAAEEYIKLYSEKIIPNLNKVKELQFSSYQNSKTNINTVIDSFKMLLMQEMNLIMAKAEYMMALAEIEMMTGEKIF